MPTITIELSDEDARQLAAAAEQRGQSATALALRWVQERLVHERERAAGGGKPMSPRARREAEGSGQGGVNLEAPGEGA